MVTLKLLLKRTWHLCDKLKFIFLYALIMFSLWYWVWYHSVSWLVWVHRKSIITIHSLFCLLTQTSVMQALQQIAQTIGKQYYIRGNICKCEYIFWNPYRLYISKEKLWQSWFFLNSIDLINFVPTNLTLINVLLAYFLKLPFNCSFKMQYYRTAW